MALLARQLYFEAVKIGDELPPLVKPPVDRIQIARYAGASLDFNPLSVDEQFARNSGFPSALAPGMLAMGFIAELAADWLRGARLRRFWARFVKIVWPGDVITSRGRVTDRRFEGNGQYQVDIELWAENQKGELVVRGGVTAQLYYNADDENRQRSGQPPVIVTPEEEEARAAKLPRSVPPRRDVPPPRPAAAPAREPAPAQVASAAGAPAAKLPARMPVAPSASQPAAAKRPPKPSKRPAARTPKRRPAQVHKKAKVKPVRPRVAARRPASKKSSKKR